MQHFCLLVLTCIVLTSCNSQEYSLSSSFEQSQTAESHIEAGNSSQNQDVESNVGTDDSEQSQVVKSSDETGNFEQSQALESNAEMEEDIKNTKGLLASDMVELVSRIQKLSEWANERNIHEVPIYVAFADIDGDNIPEFFFGYRIINAFRDYYRIYSLTEHDLIEVIHPGDWGLYYDDDDQCAIMTGEAFLGDRYYLSDTKQKYFIAIIPSGSPVNPYIVINKMWVNEQNWFAVDGYEDSFSILSDDESCTLVQFSGEIDMDDIENSIYNILEQYLAEYRKQ